MNISERRSWAGKFDVILLSRGSVTCCHSWELVQYDSLYKRLRRLLSSTCTSMFAIARLNRRSFVIVISCVLEDNAYVRTYTRAQAEVAYIEGSVSHYRFRVRVHFCFRFRFRFRRTRYCPVHMTRHTKVVRLRIIDRLSQTGVSSCK